MGARTSLVALTWLFAGMALIQCGEGSQPSGACKNDGDCASLGANWFCDLSVERCTCRPVCTGKCCDSDGCGGRCPDRCAISGQTCDLGTCTCQGTCVPKTCVELGMACGSWNDGCGDFVTCGDCPTGQVCDATGQCASTCTPQTCAQMGMQCGPWNDGCGNIIHCGSCDTGFICNASGQCVSACTPQTCTQLGKECGPWNDGCGTIIQCGDCPSGEVCNADGQCAATCTPQDCDQMSKECGPWNDGCGTIIQCGDCGPNQICNAVGQCVSTCTPLTCQQMGKECGPWNDGCGVVLDCGSCLPSESCTAQGQCEPVCTPSCSGKCCGSDGCGGTCPDTCASGSQVCNPSSCQCEGACTPNCAGRECGPDPVCGQSCGSCNTGESCNALGQCVTGTVHPGAGDYCNDSTADCPTDAGSANVCLISNVPSDGDGFCSYICSAPGADQECQADFPDGCCEELTTNNFCLPDEYCVAETQEYLEMCATPETGACRTDLPAGPLVCVGFGDDWGYCLWDCDYPGGSCPDGGECVELSGGGGVCIPPGTGFHGELCDLPLQGCSASFSCIGFGGQMGYCASTCNCQTGVGCPSGTPEPESKWSDPDGNCWCGYVCPSQNPAVDCPGFGSGWHCEDVGTGTPHWVCLPD